ncbi:MAG TPA: STAS domain-containing protein [Candidatus Wallbacteria bacterium]|nr:STAS domain-containing protein [Candidatus Wallbacteria bacterium]
MQLTKKYEKGLSIITVNGTVDALSSYVLENDLLDLMSSGKLFIVLDLSDMDYITSAGLRSLLVAAKMVNMKKGFMALCSLNEDVKKIFGMVNLENILNIYSDLFSALSAASNVIGPLPSEEKPGPAGR